MLFNSLPFLFIFLPLVLAVSMRLRANALLRWITISSFIFYAFAGQVWFLIPMLITTTADFFLAEKIFEATNKNKKRFLLIASLVGNLGMLFYFKYAGLFAKTAVWMVSFFVAPHALDSATAWVRIFDTVLPAGISFYTFQTLAYIIDVYRGEAKPEKNFWRFAGFVSFFPHLVAGPITRHNQLIPGLMQIAETGIRPQWRAGFFLFSIGLCKKVLIADRIANYIDPMLADTSHLTAASAWLAAVGYTLQIYFDFSGYSDMAIGLARLFSINLPQNFNSPYQALNPSDFWRRWHITLSRWLRDYLYITLGGNRCSAWRQKFNLMATMVLGGLWHGASWTFALWGLYHGALLVLFHLFQKKWDQFPAFFQKAATFILILFGWVFFRAETFADIQYWFSALFGLHHGTYLLPHDYKKLILLLVVGLGIVFFLPNASSSNSLGRINLPKRIALGFATAIAIVLLNYSSKFLYFQF